MKRTRKAWEMWMQRAGMIAGLAFIAAGLLGFVPLFAPNQHLFGLFHVDKAHNLIHLVTGIMAIVAALGDLWNVRLFFRIFGAAYAALGIMGFFYLEQPLFGWLTNNLANACLHTAIGTASLILGFINAPERGRKAPEKSRPRFEHQAV
jgi:hypothetical protein